MENLLYKRYGLHRIKHEVTKVEDGRIWHAAITMVSDVIIENEIDAERDIETLIRNRRLLMYGATNMLTFLNVIWPASTEDEQKYGGKAKTVVIIGYKSAVIPLSGTEVEDRLTAMERGEPFEIRLDF